LLNLGFDVTREGVDGIWLAVPYSKPDISLPADLVEEIMRVDGYDNIEIPQSITITPSVVVDGYKQLYREKVADFLVGAGFNEISTNSITNSSFFTEEQLQHSVRMLNSLTADLNMMRPSMLETGLGVIAHNLNRKNADLKLFELGKTYFTGRDGKYKEEEHLSLYVTGQLQETSWKEKSRPADIFFMKGIADRLFQLVGIKNFEFKPASHDKLKLSMDVVFNKKNIALVGGVDYATLSLFDIRQPVFFLDIDWQEVLSAIRSANLEIRELPKQLSVHRDLAMVVEKTIAYGAIERSIETIGLQKLKQVQLFDVFESDKLGTDKKSLAVSFTFLDEEKTLTDKEIEGMMNKIIESLEKDLRAQIRSN
jgi:phenylalanyl-tRNA synthetase beta chain